MKDRLLKLITSEGLTPSVLADEMGVQRSGISHILSGRNYPSFDFLQKLLTRFPKLNAEWLILGQGSMYKSSVTHIPDLFAPPVVPEKPVEVPTVSESSQKTSSGEDDKKSLPDPIPEIKPSSELKKTIEKIVTFYTDKTFTVYLPE